MRVHQKQLPIRDANEKLTNSFLAVLDNDGDPDGNAAYGNSFVTNARFADAKFFYETDRKRTLESRLPELERLQFQEKLGNYLDKTKRIEKHRRGDLRRCRHARRRAALQDRSRHRDGEGVHRPAGQDRRHLRARRRAARRTTWQAIYDHYLPINIDDALPRTLSGAIVSLADKIDTLVGFFRIGAKPTGSKDPFALRRAAQGVVQILLNRDKRCVKIGIDKLIDVALEAHGATAPSSKDDLLAFFAERVRTILEASAYGFAYDEIAAAMEAGWASSLTDLVDRITALKAMRGEANFLSILDSAKRIANITAGQETASRIDPSKLEKRYREASGRAGSIADDDQIEEMIARARLQARAGDLRRAGAGAGDVLRRSDGDGRRRRRAPQPHGAAAHGRQRRHEDRRRDEDRRRPARVSPVKLRALLALLLIASCSRPAPQRAAQDRGCRASCRRTSSTSNPAFSTSRAAPRSSRAPARRCSSPRP